MIRLTAAEAKAIKTLTTEYGPLRSPRPRANVMRNKTDLADLLAQQIRALKLPEPLREYRPFTGGPESTYPARRYSCDLAWPARRLWVEVDGGEHLIGGGGAHNRAHGMATANEKMALLTLAGWKGFRFTGGQVRNGFAIKILEQWFHST